MVQRSTGSIVVGFVMLVLGLLLLLPGSPMVYRCAPGQGGVHCTVSDRYAGLWERKRTEVDGIREAKGSTAGGISPKSGSTASLSSITLYDANQQTLYAYQESGLIGSDSETIADGVNALAAGGREAPFLRWQVGFMEALFATVMLVIAVPTLLDTARRAVTRSKGSAPVYWAEFLLVAIPFAAGWMLAIDGCFPESIAAALGVPAG